MIAVPIAKRLGLGSVLFLTFCIMPSAIVMGWFALGCGIPAVILFGIPSHKDPAGTAAYDPEGILKAITDKTKIIVIANPNNPTGRVINRLAVRELAEAKPPLPVNPEGWWRRSRR